MTTFFIICVIVFIIFWPRKKNGENNATADDILLTSDNDEPADQLSMLMRKAEEYDAMALTIGKVYVGEDGYRYRDCSYTVDDDLVPDLVDDLVQMFGDNFDHIDITYNNNDMDKNRQQVQVNIINTHNGPINGDYYNNSDYNHRSNDEAEDTEYEEVNDGEVGCNQPAMTVEEKIRYCIEKLEEDAMINFKQDYAVVLRVIQEQNIKFFTNESFARFVSAMDVVPANHKPNEGNIKMITFSEKNKMPKLKAVGCDDEKNLYYNGIANRFWSLFCGLK